MKAAVPVWENRISPVLDVARRLLLLEIVGRKVIDKKEEPLPGTLVYAQAIKIIEVMPDLLVCGAVSRLLMLILLKHNIHIVPFISGNIEDVIDAILSGKMPATLNFMPGCRFRWQYGRRNIFKRSKCLLPYDFKERKEYNTTK